MMPMQSYLSLPFVSFQLLYKNAFGVLNNHMKIEISSWHNWVIFVVAAFYFANGPLYYFDETINSPYGFVSNNSCVALTLVVLNSFYSFTRAEDIPWHVARFHVTFFNHNDTVVHSGIFYVEHSTANYIVIPFNETELGHKEEDLRMVIEINTYDITVFFDRIDVSNNCSNEGLYLCLIQFF